MLSVQLLGGLGRINMDAESPDGGSGTVDTVYTRSYAYEPGTPIAPPPPEPTVVVDPIRTSSSVPTSSYVMMVPMETAVMTPDRTSTEIVPERNTPTPTPTTAIEPLPVTAQPTVTIQPFPVPSSSTTQPTSVVDTNNASSSPQPNAGTSVEVGPPATRPLPAWILALKKPTVWGALLLAAIIAGLIARSRHHKK